MVGEVGYEGDDLNEFKVSIEPCLVRCYPNVSWICPKHHIYYIHSSVGDQLKRKRPTEFVQIVAFIAYFSFLPTIYIECVRT